MGKYDWCVRCDCDLDPPNYSGYCEDCIDLPDIDNERELEGEKKMIKKIGWHSSGTTNTSYDGYGVILIDDTPKKSLPKKSNFKPGGKWANKMSKGGRK